MRRKSYGKFPTQVSNASKKKKKTHVQQLFQFIEESPEFNDPYSELNLFLSQKIKQEIHHCSNSKKWSVQLRDELIQKITPDFQKSFPNYRLGVSALKKTWERVQYYQHQIQGEKEALTQEGKLNLPFFIRENLKTTNKLKNTCRLPPYQYAHQLAVKMSECMAVVDGVRPKLDQLTRTIWSVQKHLIPDLIPQNCKSPYDENEKIDKLIIKCILQLCTQKPYISQIELAEQILDRLIKLKQYSGYFQSNSCKQLISQLIQGCVINSSLHSTLIDWIQEEMIHSVIDRPNFSSKEIEEEVSDFFVRASAIAEKESKETMEYKIHNWTIQGDMFMRWIRLDHTSSLLTHITQYAAKSEVCFSHLFVKNVQDAYLQKYPHLSSFSRYIHGRIWIYLKYLWYTRFFSEENCTFDCFLIWYGRFFSEEESQQRKILQKLEELCLRKIPLIPFDPLHAWDLLSSEKEKKTK